MLGSGERNEYSARPATANRPSLVVARCHGHYSQRIKCVREKTTSTNLGVPVITDGHFDTNLPQLRRGERVAVCRRHLV